MKNKYEFYKLEYKSYVILFKCGNFYISINDDANVMNNIFNHKIVDNGAFIKTGFPISVLNKIIIELEKNEINYLIIDKEITNKIKFNNNHYNNYLTNNNHNLNFNRINLINKLLKDNITNPNINDILDKIEKIVCKINYWLYLK